MTLQHHDFGEKDARCVHCGARAVGPCARCQSPICGDCCVLTEGGAKTYAICLACEQTIGRSLHASWWTVMGWLLFPILVLAGLVLLLGWLFPSR